jgi:anti-sigma B factor antagonist
MTNEVKEGVLVISLVGNLLGENTNAPVMELLKQNIENGTIKVVFNLSEMKFINSTGLGMLMTALTKSRNAGGDLALSGVPDQMKKLLQMTKLETVFTVCEDVKSAIQFLNNTK